MSNGFALGVFVFFAVLFAYFMNLLVASAPSG